MKNFDLDKYILNCNNLRADINNQSAFDYVLNNIQSIYGDYIDKLVNETPRIFKFEFQLAIFEISEGIKTIGHTCMLGGGSNNEFFSQCLSLSGCVSQGRSKKEAIDNLIKAMIECSIYRKNNNMPEIAQTPKNQTFISDPNPQKHSYEDFIEFLKKFKYSIVQNSPFHKILTFKENPYSTISVLKTDTIYPQVYQRVFYLMLG